MAIDLLPAVFQVVHAFWFFYVLGHISTLEIDY